MTDTLVQKIRQTSDEIFFPYISEKGIDIDKVFFTIPGLNIDVYWYGFFIGVGALLAILFAMKKFVKFGINPDKAFDCIIGGFIGAIIGARAYYVLFSLSDYIVDGDVLWKKILSVRDGGLAIYGGLIGALLVGGIIAKIHKIRFTALFDIAAMGFLIGQGIGRWGNFINQEAYGSITKMPWGMTSNSIIEDMRVMYPDTPINDLVVHPCFLYEFLVCLVGFILLNLYLKHRKFDGEIFLLYTAWYGLGRAIIEGFRTDSLYIGDTSIRVSQLLAAVCVVVSIAIILIVRIIIKQKGNYQFFYETEISKKQLEKFEALKSKKKMKKDIKNESEEDDVSQAIENAFDEEKDNKDEISEEETDNGLNLVEELKIDDEDEEAQHDDGDEKNE